ncbi:unnamed protein product [Sphagnum balticum]
MTAIKTEDVIGTLHVICDPKLLEHHLKAVEAGGALKLMLLNSSALITSSKESFLIDLFLSLRGGLNSRYAAAALPGKDHIHQVPVFALEKSSSALFPFMEDVVDQVMTLETRSSQLSADNRRLAFAEQRCLYACARLQEMRQLILSACCMPRTFSVKLNAPPYGAFTPHTPYECEVRVSSQTQFMEQE